MDLFDPHSISLWGIAESSFGRRTARGPSQRKLRNSPRDAVCGRKGNATLEFVIVTTGSRNPAPGTLFVCIPDRTGRLRTALTSRSLHNCMAKTLDELTWAPIMNFRMPNPRIIGMFSMIPSLEHQKVRRQHRYVFLQLLNECRKKRIRIVRFKV